VFWFLLCVVSPLADLPTVRNSNFRAPAKETNYMANNQQLKKIRTKQPLEAPEQLALISQKLDKLTSRLDAMTSLFLDFLLSDPKFEEAVEYTDKVARLGELGIEIDVISGIVRRPSNYVSSRLRESKKRKFSRRKSRIAKSKDSQESIAAERS
jgi:hypothetical protein